MRKEIKHVSFDLDGTLLNSHKTIFKTTLKTLEHLNIKGVIEEKKFYSMIGHHFINIFNDLQIVVPDIDQFIDIYKRFYFDFISESEILPGALEILGYLKGKRIPVSLLTTKNQEQAEKILKHFDLSGYFSFVMGRRNGIGYKPSAEPLLLICKKINVKPEESLIVGDTELDIMCGRNANSLTCAVTFGYRERNDLEVLKPDYIISDFAELKEIV
jgi:phosphoglycolate phosphatase/pyrophosphatase PpaX